MSTSDPIAPERLEALLRGEAGADGRERRIGALLDELTLGEISPPAELRERVRSLSAAPAAVATAPRRLPRLRLRRPRCGSLPVLARRGAWRGRRRRASRDRRRAHAFDAAVNAANLKAADQHRAAPCRTRGAASRRPEGRRSRRRARPPPRARARPASIGTAPLPDGQRAQDYSASLRLAVGTVAELSRSTQSVLDTVRSLGGAIETVDYGTPSAGRGSAVIDLRVPVAAHRTRSGASPRSARSRRSRCRSATSRAGSTRRATVRARCAAASTCSRPSCSRRRSRPRSARRSRAALRTRRARSRACCAACTRRSSAPRSRASRSSSTPAAARRSCRSRTPGAFERTADDALGVISVAGRGALFAVIVGGPFVLLVGGAWWLARRFRRRAARRLLETS